MLLVKLRMCGSVPRKISFFLTFKILLTYGFIYFIEKLTELSLASGYKITENKYIQKETVNHKEGICAPRIFLQAKLKKPQATGKLKQ